MDSGQHEGNPAYDQGGSWIPATPMKPILPKPPPQPLIYARIDRNQPRSYWVGSERLSNSNEAETSSGVACYGEANGSYGWEAAQAGRFQVGCNDNGTVAKPSIDALVEGIPFLQLMALADAASTVGADATLGGNAHMFDSGSSYRIELESSSMKGRLSNSCIPSTLQMKYLTISGMLMTSIFDLGWNQMQLQSDLLPNSHLQHQIWARVNIQEERQKYSRYQLRTAGMIENRTTTVIL